LSGKKDKDYLLQEEMLTRLLLKLDTIDSGGKDEIRIARKNGIKAVQATLDQLELKLLANSNGSNRPINNDDIMESDTDIKRDSNTDEISQTVNKGEKSNVKEMVLDSEMPC